MLADPLQSGVGFMLLALLLALLLAKFEWWIARRAGKSIGISVGLFVVVVLALVVAHELYDWMAVCPGTDEKQKAFCESVILIVPSPTFFAAFFALIVSSCSVLALGLSRSIPSKRLEVMK
jgi:DMSO/TMAO reductase YedYZ heme-binding membrane subunit